MWKLSNISAKGILGGITFNIVASVILSIVVAVLFTAGSGVSIEDQVEFQQKFESSFNIRLVFLIGGLLISLGMGFVAEWLAPTKTLINAGVCGALLLLFNTTMVFINPDSAPNWSQILIILGVFPLSILGGWIIARNKNT